MTAAATHRLAGAAVLLGLFGLICAMAFAAWRLQLSVQAEVADGLEEFDRHRAVAAYGNELDALLAVGPSAALAGMTIKGATPAEASAEILLSISRHPAAARVQILRTAELPARIQGSLVLAGQSIELSGTWPALLDFIAAVEANDPELRIERMVMRAPFQGMSAPDIEPSLSAELQITAATSIAPPDSKAAGP